MRTLLLVLLVCGVSASRTLGQSGPSFDRYGIFGVGHPAGEHLVGDSPDYQELLYRRLAEAGATSVRIAVSWREIESEKGTYNWEQIDRPMSYLRKYPQIRPYLLVVNTPGWARDDGKPTHYAPHPDYLPDFRRFCKEVAERFKDRVFHYEVWNEQNGFGWETPPFNQVDKYLPVLQAAYDGLKEGNPRCKVSLGGLDDAEGYGPIFTRGAYGLLQQDYGNRRMWDAFADHPYGEAESMVSKLRAIKGIAAAFNDCGLELWLTEYGFKLEHVGNDQAQQAAKLTDYMTRIIEDPELRYVTETNYLCIADFDGNYGFGLCDANLRPREAFLAYQRLPRPWGIAVSDVVIEHLSANAVKVTWRTNPGSLSHLFWKSSESGTSGASEGATAKDHHAVISGLVPGEPCAFTIHAEGQRKSPFKSISYEFRALRDGALLNPDFEEPFVAGIAPGWECRGVNFCFESRSPKLAENRRLSHGGQRAQCIIAAGRFKDKLNDYVIGQAGADPGQSYRFSAWTYGVSDGGNNKITRRVGLDPSGGTDPAAASVVWSNRSDAAAKWEQQSVRAEAKGALITVFVHAEADGRDEKDQYFYIDDCQLSPE